MATPSLYHWMPVALSESRITLPPAQNVVELRALMNGECGVGFCTVYPADRGVVQVPFVAVTEYDEVAVTTSVEPVWPEISSSSRYHWYDVAPVAFAVSVSGCSGQA